MDGTLTYFRSGEHERLIFQTWSKYLVFVDLIQSYRKFTLKMRMDFQISRFHLWSDRLAVASQSGDVLVYSLSKLFEDSRRAGGLVFERRSQNSEAWNLEHKNLLFFCAKDVLAKKNYEKLKTKIFGEKRSFYRDVFCLKKKRRLLDVLDFEVQVKNSQSLKTISIIQTRSRWISGQPCVVFGNFLLQIESPGINVCEFERYQRTFRLKFDSVIKGLTCFGSEGVVVLDDNRQIKLYPNFIIVLEKKMKEFENLQN